MRGNFNLQEYYSTLVYNVQDYFLFFHSFFIYRLIHIRLVG